jgi:hypothetical protein
MIAPQRLRRLLQYDRVSLDCFGWRRPSARDSVRLDDVANTITLEQPRTRTSPKASAKLNTKRPIKVALLQRYAPQLTATLAPKTCCRPPRPNSHHNLIFLWGKIANGWVASAHCSPRDVAPWSMVEARPCGLDAAAPLRCGRELMMAWRRDAAGGPGAARRHEAADVATHCDALCTDAKRSGCIASKAARPGGEPPGRALSDIGWFLDRMPTANDSSASGRW